MADFLSRFRQQAISETLDTGDSVVVTGTDEFKGFKGTVLSCKNVSGENIYTVELQANTKRIDRPQQSLLKSYDV